MASPTATSARPTAPTQLWHTRASALMLKSTAHFHQQPRVFAQRTILPFAAQMARPMATSAGPSVLMQLWHTQGSAALPATVQAAMTLVPSRVSRLLHACARWLLTLCLRRRCCDMGCTPPTGTPLQVAWEHRRILPRDLAEHLCGWRHCLPCGFDVPIALMESRGKQSDCALQHLCPGFSAPSR